jgi:hypothetical protein
MIYSLPNGKVIELSIEQFLRMTDDDVQHMIARNMGDEYADPFQDSVLSDLSDDEMDRIILSELDDEDLDFDTTPDLTEISDSEKFCDEDFINRDELEY